MRTVLLFALTLLMTLLARSQSGVGIITATVVDEKSKALEGVSVQLVSFLDSLSRFNTLTDANGLFALKNIPFGYYKLKLSYVGMTTVTLDSIHFRADRYDFNLNDMVLKPVTEKSLEEVIIYAEKPLIQSKEGNITFNAGESALSAGSNASDLLTNVPLVTKDPNGKVLVRGKEPKILIDDKPVELNQQQLQDLLESLPGSSIEKIEVMTNPPPQYASESGGVINITTKKGTIGMSARLSVYAGTRGELGTSGSFNYRKQTFTMNIVAGLVQNNFDGEGYSHRQNFYTDSTNYFNTENRYQNKNTRPNFRTNINWELNKAHSLNLVLNYNGNNYDNQSTTENTNLNRFSQVYRLNERTLSNSGEAYNPTASITYTFKTKRLGETVRLIYDFNYSNSEARRGFFQQFLTPDHRQTGKDSTQQQATNNDTYGNNLRLSYDLPTANYKTFLSAGGFFNSASSYITSDASYLRKADQQWVPLSALINQFRFKQYVNNFRVSVKQILGKNFSTTAGMSAELTRFRFNLYKSDKEAANDYWSYLPFATLNKSWENNTNITFSYRRTIRRPGVAELNPTVDSADAYTIRAGNTSLLPSLSHNFDLVLGKTHKSFYINLGIGYNSVEDVFSQIRTRLSDTTTLITWENISGRKEYEVSTWSGFTVSKRTKMNLSASYSYNVYGDFDKEVRKFRNGGTFTSNFNTSYTIRDLYSAISSFTFNRFANPQGVARSSLSMNIGLQAKLLQKKVMVTLNIIDPFTQQENRTLTYGPNFNQENYSQTNTRNFRLTLAYNFSKSVKKPVKSLPAKKPVTNTTTKQ